MIDLDTKLEVFNARIIDLDAEIKVFAKKTILSLIFKIVSNNIYKKIALIE